MSASAEQKEFSLAKGRYVSAQELHTLCCSALDHPTNPKSPNAQTEFNNPEPSTLSSEPEPLNPNP